MENRDRTEAPGTQGGGTPYHEDEPIQGQGQGGRQDQGGMGGQKPGQGGGQNQPGRQGGQTGRPGQGGDEDDTNENIGGGSRRGDDTGQPGRQQGPTRQVSPTE
jgi:hypothetical protein